MENTGRVRNIIVKNYYEFEDNLIRKLTRFGIGYVKLGNEFHFLDRIYRFYDVKKDRTLILEKEEFINSECIICVPLDIVCLRDKTSFVNYFNKFEGEFTVSVVDDFLHFEEAEYRPIKKNDNRKTGKKIKKKSFFHKLFNERSEK